MQHSHTHREIVTGKTIHVFINGDLFFKAKAIVVHPKSTRSFEALLIRLTEILNPRFGAVLHLKTPDGTTEIKSLGELVSGASYVAYGKKFQALDYSDISAKLESFSHGGQALTSPREFKRMIVSGRARKIVRHPILINVYANGEPLKPAKRVLLQPWVHKTWDNVLEQIASKVVLRSAIRKLIDLSTKTPVTFGADLRDQQFYVACGTEKFKDFEYGLSPTMFTPKQQMAKRYPSLPPIEPRERLEAAPKTSNSAPTEKPKDELHPKPPPGKRPTDESAERAQRKPHKLRTPSPQDSLVEEERHSSNSYDGPPTKSENNHRVSPILEQKTPSSTRTGPKEEVNEVNSEPKVSVNNSRNASPSLNTPRKDEELLESGNKEGNVQTPPTPAAEVPASSRPHSSVNNSPTPATAREPTEVANPDSRPNSQLDGSINESNKLKSENGADEKTGNVSDIPAAEDSADDKPSEDFRSADSTVEGEAEKSVKVVKETLEEEETAGDKEETTGDARETAGEPDIADGPKETSADDNNTAKELSADNTSSAVEPLANKSSPAEDTAADNTTTANQPAADNTKSADDASADNPDAAEKPLTDKTNAEQEVAADNTKASNGGDTVTESKEEEGRTTPSAKDSAAELEKEPSGKPEDDTTKDSTAEPDAGAPIDGENKSSRPNSAIAPADKDANNNNGQVALTAPVETQG